MQLKIVVAVVGLSMGLVAAQAYAEGEGSGEPFAWRAPAQASTGRPFVADTGSAAYPALSGEVFGQPSAVRMAAAGGSETAVQSVNSLPRGFEEGTAAYANEQSVTRYVTRPSPLRVAVSGKVRY